MPDILKIPAVFVRGGTSRAVFFHSSDLKDFSSQQIYNYGDIVSHNGRIFMCGKDSNQYNSPNDTSYWKCIGDLNEGYFVTIRFSISFHKDDSILIYSVGSAI